VGHLIGDRTITETPSPPDAGLISPYGGPLVDLIVDEPRAAEMKASARDHPSVTLDERGLCDLELLAVGGFSPLRGFLGKADYDRVVAEGRLADGTRWPLPITLPVTPGDGVAVGTTLALRDVYGNLLAFLHVEELYPFDQEAEASGVYGTTNARPPAVEALNHQPDHYVSGKLEVIRVPPHYDFVELRRTPRELRDHFAELGWSRVVAFQAHAPIHRAEEELTKRAAQEIAGGLLIHPVVGVTIPGDVDHYTRVRSVRALVDHHYEPGSVVLSLLPFAERMAGPRDSLLHAIIARNYGCTHFLAPDFAREDLASVDMGIVALKPMVYLPEQDAYCPIDAVPTGVRTSGLTETEVRDDDLARGIPLPDWFSRPAVVAILNEARRPKFRQGLTIWFTGLSGSGKSTVAHALIERLAEYGRNVSMLDGDEIRTHLSKGLSFSREDRDININRVGYVAGLVAQHGGTTLCSVISPYRAPRENARKASQGNFVEVYCDTPIEVCESRDVKGLYAKARNAVLEGNGIGFTGIDDPYEAPLNPEVTIDTSQQSVAECVDAIITRLFALGYILPHGQIAVERA
jgi:sulfate adenylyltransferase